MVYIGTFPEPFEQTEAFKYLQNRSQLKRSETFQDTFTHVRGL